MPLALFVALAGAPTALAQPSPGQFPTGGEGQPEEKPGVAETAPKPTAAAMPTTPVLPPPDSTKKRWKAFSLDGFFRFRYAWQKNFHMGFVNDATVGGAPYPRPLDCNNAVRACEDDNVFSGNMKLRLNPSFAINEGTGVYSTLDILDNVVMGSASSGPLAALSDGQWGQDSIAVRRLWMELATPLGTLKVGRMPEHFGTGMTLNGGERNEMTGARNFDADSGDTVDRLSFATTLPRSGLRVSVANDWVGTRLTTQDTATNSGLDVRPFDLDDSDDVNQWVIAVAKLSTPSEFSDAASRGDFTFNWAARLGYRTQSNDYVPDADSPAPDPDAIVARGYKGYVPGGWLRAAWRAFEFEGELGGHFGSIDSLGDQGVSNGVSIRQWGGVAKLHWTGMNNELKVGVEVGSASGDDHDNSPQGSLSLANATWFAANDKTQSRFVFDPNYHVDMIMFRKLMGAVSNATYVRPSLVYQVSKSWRANAASIISFANKPVSTPGNDSFLGMEFNANIGYYGHGIEAVLGYGVLFPFEGLAHPEDAIDEIGPNFGYANGSLDNSGNAETAHALEARLVLSF